MKKIYLPFFAGMVGFLSVFGLRYYQSKNPVVVNLPVQAESLESILPVIPQPDTSQISSDGTKKLIMKTISNKDGTKTYNFLVSNGDGIDEQIVFSKTLGQKTISIPYNAWSPDNKYFFIQEGEGREAEILVFKSSGEGLDQDQKYINATELFKKRGLSYNFAEATGWASEALILINTVTQEGEKGPSFWFELPSLAIIQLGTRF